MKRNRKGFTLVELLAVIVILALLIVITANTILPMMNKTKKNAMMVYASSVLEKASANYIIDSMYNSGEPKSYSIENMMGGNTNYRGVVKVSTTADGKYKYDIEIQDKEEKLGLKAVNLESTEIKGNVDEIVSQSYYTGEDRFNNPGFVDNYNITADMDLFKMYSSSNSLFEGYLCANTKDPCTALGEPKQNRFWRSTDYIPIESGATYKFKLIGHDTMTWVENDGVFYTGYILYENDSKTVHSVQSYHNYKNGNLFNQMRGDEYTFEVPSGVGYIRITFSSKDNAKASLIKEN